MTVGSAAAECSHQCLHQSAAGGSTPPPQTRWLLRWLLQPTHMHHKGQATRGLIGDQHKGMVTNQKQGLASKLCCCCLHYWMMTQVYPKQQEMFATNSKLPLYSVCSSSDPTAFRYFLSSGSAVSAEGPPPPATDRQVGRGRAVERSGKTTQRQHQTPCCYGGGHT